MIKKLSKNNEQSQTCFKKSIIKTLETNEKQLLISVNTFNFLKNFITFIYLVRQEYKHMHVSHSMTVADQRTNWGNQFSSSTMQVWDIQPMSPCFTGNTFSYLIISLAQRHIFQRFLLLTRWEICLLSCSYF